MRARDRIATLAGIALLATACGGGGGSGSGVAATSSASSRQPYLAYSRCMQTHGAPFWPDPSTSTRRSPAYTITSRILAQEHGPSWNAALTACAKKAPSQLPLTEAQLVAAGTRLLKVTRCMRAHGYPNWPDPIVNPNAVGFQPPRGVNISDPSPRLKAAGQACHLPSVP
jgi:hypothetical protein